MFSLGKTCLRNKVLELEVLLKENKFQVIYFNEHWLKTDEIALLNLNGFTAISSFLGLPMHMEDLKIWKLTKNHLPSNS
ncbi:hypothetical protein NQ317_005729 [Molorchus minor]|uniref:Uncharacterized protein n=1 Tax=Molorchus minor TaxID=1323400 RepID=A0ABQ9IQY2_9CUCU|nr:hypothetical protein NQ317_005729 [Molorchus minor]